LRDVVVRERGTRRRKRNSGEYDERSEKTTFRIFVCVLQKASNSSFVSSKTGQVYVFEQAGRTVRFGFRVGRVVKIVRDGTKRADTRWDNV
jgi:hypothetical protein